MFGYGFNGSVVSQSCLLRTTVICSRKHYTYQIMFHVAMFLTERISKMFDMFLYVFDQNVISCNTPPAPYAIIQLLYDLDVERLR